MFGAALIMVASVLSLCVIINTVIVSAEPVVELPTLELELRGTTLDEINAGSKDTKYGGTKVTLTGDGAQRAWENVEIKGRGNFTWTEPKKPYRLKFKEKVSLLGMDETKKWVLLTNNFDDSLMRNDLGMFVAHEMGIEYNLIGEFVRLVVDGKGLGVYYVTRAIEVDNTSLSMNDLYGVLVEVDNMYCENEEVWYRSQAGDCLTIKDSVNDGLQYEAMEKFLAKYNRFEVAVRDGNYALVEELVDIKSFADYFVFSEFIGNPDAYVTSYYMYMDGEDDKIHVGPVWDFDKAFGNVNWRKLGIDEEYYGPWSEGFRHRQAFGAEKYEEQMGTEWEKGNELISRTLYYLTEMPEFMELARTVYDKKLSLRRQEVIEQINENAQLIRDAAVIDAEIWGKNDFDEAVEYLKWWVEERFRFFDTKFGGIIIDESVEM